MLKALAIPLVTIGFWGVAAAHAPTLNDPQVIGIANSLNLGEIAEAQAVVDRLQTPAARYFAKKMINDHTGLDDTLSLLLEYLGLNTEDSKINRRLIRMTEEEIAKLNATPTEQLDCVYMTAQVEDHANALQLHDNVLIPNASNPFLKIDLEGSRAIVAGHLAISKMIVSQLGCAAP